MALAVSAGAVVFWQYTSGLLTVGAAGRGFTVMVKLDGAPGQPFRDGVTVMVAVTGEVPVLVALKLLILPVPVAARPILVALLVQL